MVKNKRGSEMSGEAYGGLPFVSITYYTSQAVSQMFLFGHTSRFAPAALDLTDAFGSFSCVETRGSRPGAQCRAKTMTFSRFAKLVTLGDRLESVSGSKASLDRTLGAESLILGRSRCKDKAGKVRYARF